MKNYHQFDREIPLEMASAMFGPAGAEELRNGEGWVDRKELGLGWLIYAFTRVQKPKVIVEIGAGGSSFCALRAIRDNGIGHLHTIDCWPEKKPCTNWPNDHIPIGVPHMFHENGEPFEYEHAYFLDMVQQKEYKDICTLYYAKGEEKAEEWDIPIDMIILDAGHKLEETIREWEGLAKWLKPSGYALLHDPLGCIQEVGMMLENFCNEHKDFSMLIEPNFLAMAIVQKKWSLSLEHFWFAYGLTRPKNPQNFTTPIHLTDARGSGMIKEFNGSYFPHSIEELYESYNDIDKIANDLINSGEEQTLDKTKLVDDYLLEKNR
jgi:hypothetical protein